MTMPREQLTNLIGKAMCSRILTAAGNGCSCDASGECKWARGVYGKEAEAVADALDREFVLIHRSMIRPTLRQRCATLYARVRDAIARHPPAAVPDYAPGWTGRFGTRPEDYPLPGEGKTLKGT